MSTDTPHILYFFHIDNLPHDDSRKIELMNDEVGSYHSGFNLPGIIAREFIYVKKVLDRRNVRRYADHEDFTEMLVNKQVATGKQ
ncbi:hypothetical protein E4U19_003163 [Claviceps sp. Clav32 group G5]|nr:hypothetical protein E4U40_004722 [Claviceps sp. LM458 group G5]KAG6025416.1 hypothetical protein E4U19_003163 [Claviceps sp. Clav32 group G5]